ncbi:hypothetical protein F7725_003106 [Dissostichus mawsoni]|uniref:Uncharacterized protein n=1 Tax=Dissostichus mawsoni TaxID=36200 RepID=A0A7J5YCG8_DISMA|nr:hypothetical protein F7725_003106 [Dissostichus mawsoni]
MIVMSTAVPTSKKMFQELYEDEVIFAPLCNGKVSVPVWWKLKSSVSIFPNLCHSSAHFICLKDGSNHYISTYRSMIHLYKS